jgi:hypothetical protein
LSYKEEGDEMKRKYLALVFVMFLIGGCTNLNPNSGAPGETPGGTVLSTPTEEIGRPQVTATENPAPTPIPPNAGNPNDECGNPYYPVVNGAQWIYGITTASDGSTSTANYSMETGEDGLFSITIQGDDSTAVLRGQCTDDGIILMDAPGISGSFSSDGGGSTMTTQNVEGVTLPNDVLAGDDWSQVISIVAQSSSGDTILSATIETNYVALGYEIVTVPAGSFTALKVEQTGSMTMGASEPYLTRGFLWYAQGIGIVKSGLDDTYNSELSQYAIP